MKDCLSGLFSALCSCMLFHLFLPIRPRKSILHSYLSYSVAPRESLLPSDRSVCDVTRVIQTRHELQSGNFLQIIDPIWQQNPSIPMRLVSVEDREAYTWMPFGLHFAAYQCRCWWSRIHVDQCARIHRSYSKQRSPISAFKQNE